ncbi:MAG: hypothetical protein HY290_27420 [Planctomycetia bacterium]|nr:hypothetical protein [Planctomycetia bacterium]
MPLCELDATDQKRRSRSRLGESLLRLQLHLEQARTTEVAAEEQFDSWRARWSERREQISQRLELIDRQLESLVQSQPTRPQLSLVAGHGPDDGHLSLLE